MKTFALLLGVAFIGLAHADNNPVIVHEWGTFTCLQDENGKAIGGINVDDEPVPNFVCGAGQSHVRNLNGNYYGYGQFGLPPYSTFTKGWNPADSDVTMRLETPVLYIYPPKGQASESVPPLDVHVDFHHGVLSQYYPYAEGNGFPEGFRSILPQHIRDLTTELNWKDVQLGSTEKPVETSDKVWTTPRETSAPVLQVMAPGAWQGNVQGPEVVQAEHFLFYRGIGQLDSPLKIRVEGIDPGFTRLHVLADAAANTYDVPRAWLVQIRADGVCAFRAVPSLQNGTRALFGNRSELGSIDLSASMSFQDSDFSPDYLASLKTSMQEALVENGLYSDEAAAMLKTWELSYFKSPGLRFFYIVPRAWVDKVLPLTVTGAPTDITRVMIGRIELISASQKATLQRLAMGPCPNLLALKEVAQAALDKRALTKDEKEAYFNGAKSLSDLGITIPPLVQDYLSLGRFRDPLIVHEQQLHPSPALAQFIKDNQLAPSN